MKRVMLAIALVLATDAQAQMAGQGGGHGMIHGHGADGSGHDEVTMPGLRGLDATPEESAEMALMFRNFRKLERSVMILPNGIATLTSASDPGVMDALVSHVTGMITRVEEGRDPQVFIQSPVLDIIFERRARLRTEIEMTDAGIKVTQTSDDPELVAALHRHAGEVTDMAEQGMHAVHMRMMRQQTGN